MPGCYYINPQVVFKGDRLTLIKQWVMEQNMKPQTGIEGNWSEPTLVKEPESEYYTEYREQNNEST
jgi:hypothetical protein